MLSPDQTLTPCSPNPADEEEAVVKSLTQARNKTQETLLKNQNKLPKMEEIKKEKLLSPRFRFVAAMASWDEEALMIASAIVEDTLDRHFKQKKCPNLQSSKPLPRIQESRKKSFKFCDVIGSVVTKISYS